MSNASGISVVGSQGLLYETGGLASAAIYIAGGFPLQAKNQGFISVHINNGAVNYFLLGESLWYEGVVFFNMPIGAYPYTVVASWHYAGLNWTIDTF